MKNQFKASTLCASSALLVLGGFMSINLAGCGGGGGGGGNSGGFGTPTATPGPQNITFRLLLQNQAASNGGTVTLTSATGATFTASATSSGLATLTSVPSGTYTVKFTVLDSTGTAVSTTTSTVNITRNSGQTYLLIQDQGTGSTGDFTVSGTIRINPRVVPTATPKVVNTPIVPSATATPGGTPDPFQFSNCTASSEPVNGPVLVEAIDLDTAQGRPIVAQLRRSAGAANRGGYTITLPYSVFRNRPATFQIRIGQYDVSGARYAGFSAAFNFNGRTSLSNVDICVNENGVAPQIPVTTTFTPTSTPFFFFTPVPGTTPGA